MKYWKTLFPSSDPLLRYLEKSGILVVLELPNPRNGLSNEDEDEEAAGVDERLRFCGSVDAELLEAAMMDRDVALTHWRASAEAAELANGDIAGMSFREREQRLPTGRETRNQSRVGRANG